MARSGSALWFLLTLPFRRGVRWLTLLLLLVAAAGWWTGHLGLAAHYAFWRFYPGGPPLVSLAPADTQSLLLVDASLPGSGRLEAIAKLPRIQAKLNQTCATLGCDPGIDLLQVLMTTSPSEGRMVVIRGRFRPATATQALTQRGYRVEQERPVLLLSHAESGRAQALVGRNLAIEGSDSAVRKTLARLHGELPALSDEARFEHWVEQLGRRHTLVALVRQAAHTTPTRAHSTGLELTALSADTRGEENVQLVLQLGPDDPASLAKLEQQANATLRALQGGARLVAAAHTQRLIAGARVERGAQTVRLESEATPADLSELLRDVDDPQVLLVMVGGVAAALVAGQILQGFGLSPGSSSGVAPGSSSDSVRQAVGGLLQKLGEQLGAAASPGSRHRDSP